MIKTVVDATRRWMGAAALGVAIGMSSGAAQANERNLAPGFAQLPAGSKIVVMPVDVELFSISAGGVLEPKADWTASAQNHIRSSLDSQAAEFGVETMHLPTQDSDDFGEQISLHAAVAQSIALHHSFGGGWSLPTKEGKLNWSFGEAMREIKARTGARYGLFTWVRDSYASAERKATIVLMAVIGVHVGGGIQTGYASLVDLETGQVVWFNQLVRTSGDLREIGPATESVKALLKSFPKKP
jgi:hypothetical protein